MLIKVYYKSVFLNHGSVIKSDKVLSIKSLCSICGFKDDIGIELSKELVNIHNGYFIGDIIMNDEELRINPEVDMYFKLKNLKINLQKKHSFYNDTEYCKMIYINDEDLLSYFYSARITLKEYLMIKNGISNLYDIANETLFFTNINNFNLLKQKIEEHTCFKGFSYKVFDNIKIE